MPNFNYYVQGSPSTLFDEANPDWSPSINLGYKKMKPSDIGSHWFIRRQQRAECRRRTVGEQVVHLPEDFPPDVAMDASPQETTDPADDNPSTRDFGCQTDLTIDMISAVEFECQSLRSELQATKS